MNRVVVTGLGVVSPVGSGREGFWRSLTAGESGIGPVTLLEARSLPVRICGEVRDLDLQALVDRIPVAGGERDRKVLLGLAAAEESLTDAGLSADVLRKAVLQVGVGLEVFFLEDVTARAGAEDPTAGISRSVMSERPDRPLQSPLDRLSDLLGDHFGIFGGRHTNCSACAAGAQVIGEAFHMLQDGQARVAIAGAADSMVNPLGLGGFSLLRVLSRENDRPQSACRPFAAGREGTVIGEGAAFLVMETLDHARDRDARIYAELLGYGSSMDAYRVSDPEPNGRGAVLSMRAALADAKLQPEQVDCVNAHATGTLKNDVVETAALKEVLGPRASQVPVHAVKSMTGHMIAASGAAEAVAAIMTVHTGQVPPTINLDSPDPECDLDYVVEGVRPFVGRTVLSNSFGFGGQNATLIVARYDV